MKGQALSPRASKGAFRIATSKSHWSRPVQYLAIQTRHRHRWQRGVEQGQVAVEEEEQREVCPSKKARQDALHWVGCNCHSELDWTRMVEIQQADRHLETKTFRFAMVALERPSNAARPRLLNGLIDVLQPSASGCPYAVRAACVLSPALKMSRFVPVVCCLYCPAIRYMPASFELPASR